MKFSTIPLPDSERVRQYYQIIPGDQLSSLYVFQVRHQRISPVFLNTPSFQIKYSNLINGDHVDVEIKIFYANFTSEIGDDGNRVVDVKTLDTYQFQEDVDHEVTYQANIELLKVNEGMVSPSRIQPRTKK